MEIRTVRFEAFKSLYDVSCELSHLTTITGPNGAGKSNFVDALNFLGEVYTHGLEFAVSRAGGYDNIAHRRTRRAKRPIAMTVSVDLNQRDLRELHHFYGTVNEDTPPIPSDFELTYQHSFSFRTAGQGILADYEVQRDTIQLFDRSQEKVFELQRLDNGVDAWVTSARGANAKLVRDIVSPFGDKNYEKLVRPSRRKIIPTALISEQVMFTGLFWLVGRALSGIRIFQLSPHQCRIAGVPTPNAVLERHGDNLPGAADHLRRNDKAAWQKVQRAMRSILPNLRDIEIAYTEDRRLALQFREEGGGRPWTTGEVSDGTIQALALYIALYDRRNPMLVIEEPENAVHPWILRQFVDHCSESASKQIVLTTHSPVLLDYVNPSIVQIMTLHHGRSRIERLVDLSHELKGLVSAGDISLFEGYDSGVVKEAVPPGMQSGEGA